MRDLEGSPMFRSNGAKFLLVICLAVATSSCLPSDGPPPPEETAKGQQFATDQLARKAEQGGVTKQLALDAFASLIRKIPGGNPVDGGIQDDTSGTMALLWILGFYDELNGEQQSVVQLATRGSREKLSDPARTARSFSLSSSRQASDEFEFQSFVNKTVDNLVFRYPSLKIPSVLLAFPEQIESGFATAPGNLAAGVDAATQGKTEFCWLYVSPKNLKRFIEERGKGPTWPLETIVVHELMHCAQLRAVSDVAYVQGASYMGWLIEGSAQWAQYRYAHDATGTPDNQALPDAPPFAPAISTYSAGLWDNYLGKPEDQAMAPPRSLFTRQYDALGFFAHIELSGLNPWTTVTTMMASLGGPSGSKSNDEAAFEAASRTPDFLRHWAMGMVRQRNLGPNWDTSGPEITDYVPALETHVVSDSPTIFEVPAAASDRQEVTFKDRNDKILQISTSSSQGGFYWRGGSRGIEEEFQLASAARAYCLDPDGCSCPQGQAYAGLDQLESPPLPAADSLLIAFTGGSRPGKVTINTAPLPCKPVASCSGNTDLRSHSNSDLGAKAGSVTSCPVPVCSSAAQQEVQSIIGENVEPGRRFSSEGTTGCLWLQTSPVNPDCDFCGGPNGDYVILGRRTADPHLESAQSFKLFNESQGLTCGPDQSLTSITCSGLDEGVAQAERWYGPGDALGTAVLVRSSQDPISLAIRVLDEVPRT